jgi:hypothetical protein
MTMLVGVTLVGNNGYPRVVIVLKSTTFLFSHYYIYYSFVTLVNFSKSPNGLRNLPYITCLSF